MKDALVMFLIGLVLASTYTDVMQSFTIRDQRVKILILENRLQSKSECFNTLATKIAKELKK